MGYMIGMPCLKLNNVGRKSASCGGFKSVAEEALEERKGRDPDIDRDLTPDNIYTGYRTAAELMEYSNRHVAEMSEQLQAEGKRKIRQDAVVMIATIIKPPAAFMATLSQEDRVRFLSDSKEKLEEIIGQENVKSSVMHFDEQGGHLHAFWEPMTKDGRLCAKEACNLKFFARLNKEMPEFLRSRGWDIDNCNAYDEAKEALKSEQEKSQERKKRGLTSVQYKAQAEAEKNRLCEEIDSLETEKSQLREKIDGLEAEITSLQKQASAASIEAEKQKREIEEQELIIADNEVWMGEQAEIMGLYQTRAEYLDGGQKAQQAMDDIQEDLDSLPEQHKLFRAKDAESWRQRTTRRLQSMMKFVKDTIGKLQIFEKEYPDEAPERLSKPAKKRAAALDDVINGARGKSEQSAATGDQLSEYYQDKDAFWVGCKEAMRVAQAQQAKQSDNVRWWFGQYAKAQYLVKNCDTFIGKGITMIGVWVTGADLARERKREQEILKTRDDLAELCREAISLDAVQKDARRRNELTEELEREILEHQDSIIARLKEIREKQGFKNPQGR